MLEMTCLVFLMVSTEDWSVYTLILKITILMSSMRIVRIVKKRIRMKSERSKRRKLNGKYINICLQ